MPNFSNSTTRYWISATIALGCFIALVQLGVRYSFEVPGKSHDGPLPAATSEELALKDRLQQHVVAIASKPHNLSTPENYAELERSADYIEDQLKALGLSPWSQVFEVADHKVRNIEVAFRGADSEPGHPVLVLGAHYDSAPVTPGANDNGSGVAALIELARLLRASPPQQYEVRLAFFVNEEDPYFGTEAMGSYRYAKQLHEDGVKVAGMISLETIGAYSDTPGSQSYPLNFGLHLPDKANFIAFVGMPGSRDFMHAALASFRTHTQFPSMGATVSSVVPGVSWSDHEAFSGFGYPAFMITDTALFRYPHYHKPTDTPEKVDYDKLARITKGIERVVRELKLP